MLLKKILGEEYKSYMLENLGIYGDVRGEVFEKELRNIKKLVK